MSLVEKVKEHIASEHPLKITILKDNIFQIGESMHFRNVDDFINSLGSIKDKFFFDGGNEREFYVSNENSKNYTFQFSEFKFENNHIELLS